MDGLGGVNGDNFNVYNAATNNVSNESTSKFSEICSFIKNKIRSGLNAIGLSKVADFIFGKELNERSCVGGNAENFQSVKNQIQAQASSSDISEPTNNPFENNNIGDGNNTTPQINGGELPDVSVNKKKDSFDYKATMICRNLDGEAFKNLLSNFREQEYKFDSPAFFNLRMVFENALENTFGIKHASENDIIRFFPGTLKQFGIENKEIDEMKSSYLKCLSNEISIEKAASNLRSRTFKYENFESENFEGENFEGLLLEIKNKIDTDKTYKLNLEDFSAVRTEFEAAFKDSFGIEPSRDDIEKFFPQILEKFEVGYSFIGELKSFYLKQLD